MSWNNRRPQPGSVEAAAQKIERLMDLNAEQRYRSRNRSARHDLARNPGVDDPSVRPLRALAMTSRSPLMSALAIAEPTHAVVRGAQQTPSDLRFVEAEGTAEAPVPMPLLEEDAFDHYRFGDGSPRAIPIGRLTLNAPVALTQFPSVGAILSGQQVGTFRIDENADFEVLDDEYGGVLGGVSVNLKGQLIVRPNGTYEFQGDYGIEPDRYDFDPKDWGERDPLAELAVRAVDWFVPGTPYTNHVLGRVSVRERGAR